MVSIIQKLLDSALADKNHSSVSFAERIFLSPTGAAAAFSSLKENIRDLNLWNQAASLNNFELFDKTGRKCQNELLKKNLFVRMSLKGSGKYDWVKIAKITESENLFIVSVKPIFDPTDINSDKAHTSHFFMAESSNNFCLIHEDKKITFFVIGLNEKQNVSEAKNAFEIVRNVATANIGSYFGIQKAEWKTFCENFLELYNSQVIK